MLAPAPEVRRGPAQSFARVATRLLLGVAMVLFACDSTTDRGGSASKDLPDGVVARVGGSLVRPADVAVVGSPSSPETVDAVVADLLLAVGARERLPHRAAVVERAVLGRALRESIRRRVLEENPPNAAEVRRAIEANWLLYDRPRAVRAVVARLPVPRMARDENTVRALSRMVSECAGFASVDELTACIRAIDPNVSLLRAPPVDARGRAVPQHQADRTLPTPTGALAAAIGSLAHPGDVTGVVPGDDDYQAGFATDVIPADPLDEPEERQALLAGLASPRVNERIAKILASSGKQVTRTTKVESALLGEAWRQ